MNKKLIDPETTELSKEKTELINQIITDYQIPVKLYDNNKLRYKLNIFLDDFAMCYAPPIDRFCKIYLEVNFAKDLTLNSLEHVLLHEVGHYVLGTADEKLAECFAIQEFSGNREDYMNSWATTMYRRKTGRSVDNLEIGEKIGDQIKR